MSWPTRTWTQDGWREFPAPLYNVTPEGLPVGWDEHAHEMQRSGVLGYSEIEGMSTVVVNPASFWDVMDNPIYEVAAEALGLPGGLSWTDWVAQTLTQVGSREDYEAARDYMNTPNAFTAASAEWATLTPAQQAIVQGMNSSGAYGEGRADNEFPGRDSGDTIRRQWGIDRGAFSGITNVLDDVHQWLFNTIQVFDLSDAPIIRRGPEGSDYGIDGDIWEHYGLDRAPEAPKEMDVHYNFNLLTARPSSRTYATPKGYPELDTSTETISGPTSYDTYMDTQST